MVRVHAWQNPFADIDGGGYQLSQSLFAIGTGGYAGSGLTQGAAGSIPVSESDFIFSAICEELGVIFGLAMILVIVSIFLSFANVAMKCKEPFYKLCRTWIFKHLYCAVLLKSRWCDKIHSFHRCDTSTSQLWCQFGIKYPHYICDCAGGICNK